MGGGLRSRHRGFRPFRALASAVINSAVFVVIFQILSFNVKSLYSQLVLLHGHQAAQMLTTWSVSA